VQQGQKIKEVFLNTTIIYL